MTTNLIANTTHQENPLMGLLKPEEEEKSTIQETQLVERLGDYRMKSSLRDDGFLISPNLQLGREFLIHNDTITDSTHFVYQPVVHLQAGALAPIASILSNYRFYRFESVRVRFVVNAAPMQYGFIILTPVPWSNGGETPSQYLSRKHAILNVTSSDSFVMDLPWILSAPRWPWTLAAQLQEMWAVNLDANIENINVGGPSTLTLQVFISFLGLQPSVPYSTVTSLAQHQSFTSTAANIISLAPAIYNGITQAAETVNKVDKSINQVKGVSETVSGWLGKDDSVSRHDASKTSIDPVEDNHGNPVRFDIHGDTSKLGSIEGKRMLDSYYPLISPSMVSDVDSHSLWQIMRDNPFFASSFKLNTVNPTFDVRINPTYQLITLNSYTGFMPYFAQFFKYWKGSLEVSVVLTTSSLVSANFLFALITDGATPNAGQCVGQVPTCFRSVRGTDQVTFVVPFIKPYEREFTFLNQYDFILRIFLQSIVSPSDDVCSVFARVYIRPGNDFRFEQSQGCEFIPPIIAEHQMMSSDVFHTRQCFPNFPEEDTTVSPWSMTVEQLMSKWSARFVGTGYTTPTYRSDRFPDFTSFASGLYDALATLFCFNSGSLTYRSITTNTSSNIEAGLYNFNPNTGVLYNQSQPSDGRGFSNNGQWPILDVDAPFLERYLLSFNGQCSGGFPGTLDDNQNISACFTDTSEGGEFQTCWIRPGSDFQQFVLYVPPIGARWPWYETPTRRADRVLTKGKKKK